MAQSVTTVAVRARSRCGGTSRIRRLPVTVLTAVKLFGGKQAFGALYDLRKRGEDDCLAAEIELQVNEKTSERLKR